MNNCETIKLAGVIRESIVDGPGMRFVLFTQGCPHHCKNCHNPTSWDFDGGDEYTIHKILDEILKNPLLDGITLSGGEPFCQSKPLSILAKSIREKGRTIMAYTGYTFEELLSENDFDRMALLKECDWLVDGLYIDELRSLELRFRGSKNQRILDVPTSLLEKKAVLSPLHTFSNVMFS